VSFVKRRIDLTFQLGTGTFGESGTNTVTCSGLRVHAHIDKVFGPGMGEAQIRVHGLTPSLLNQLSSLNQATMATRKNTVIVSAGDDVSGMATVFQGQIMISQIMLNTAPDTALMILAQAGAFAAVQTVQPTSYPETADAAVVMQNLAHLAGLDFENNGVSMQLATPYYPGTPLEQIRKCAQAGRAVFDYVIDDKTLAIFPVGGGRGSQIPVISPEAGMVGYPNYSTSVYGIELTTLFNPLLRPGGKVQVKSSLEVANGTWQVFNLQHELESEDPGGQWFTRFSGSSLKNG
jgi:hypothetical protein